MEVSPLRVIRKTLMLNTLAGRSLRSAVSIAVLAICLSRTIFNLSSLCSAVSTSLMSLCLSLSLQPYFSFIICLRIRSSCLSLSLPHNLQSLLSGFAQQSPPCLSPYVSLDHDELYQSLFSYVISPLSPL